MDSNNSMKAGSTRVKIYVSAIIFLCFLVVGLVLGVTFIRPTESNIDVIGLVIGIFAPTVTALIAGALKENHDATNNRLTQLLELTKKAALAEGKAQSEKD